jgi:hypothetical protein
MTRAADRAAARAAFLLLAAALLLAGCRGDARRDAELTALVDALLPRLEALAGLEALAPVRVERQPRRELEAYVLRQLDEQLPDTLLRAIHGTYAALGLVPDTLDLRALLVELYTEQVMGYYDPKTQTLYLVEGLPAAALEPVLAHELVHALQDQHADLEALIAPERGNDRRAAAQAAAEGHATVVMLALTAQEATTGAVDIGALPDLGAQLRGTLEAQHERFPVFRRAPRVVRETLLFPYLGGASFVQALWRAAAAGELEPAPYPAPFGPLLPQSTQQVLHPEAHFLRQRTHPVEITLADAADPAVAGEADGWRVLFDDVLGELELGIFLSEHLGAAGRALATGWRGDRIRLLESGQGGRALVWFTVWADAAAADRFADAYPGTLVPRRGRGARVERVELHGLPAVVVVDAAAGVAPATVPLPAVAAVREVPG